MLQPQRVWDLRSSGLLRSIITQKREDLTGIYFPCNGSAHEPPKCTPDHSDVVRRTKGRSWASRSSDQAAESNFRNMYSTKDGFWSASHQITVHSVSGTAGWQPHAYFSFLHINWGRHARFICFTFRPQKVPNSRSTNDWWQTQCLQGNITSRMVTQKRDFKIQNNPGEVHVAGNLYCHLQWARTVEELYCNVQQELEVCTVYGDRTVCSCRHSKSSAWVRSMYCVWRPYCVQL